MFLSIHNTLYNTEDISLIHVMDVVSGDTVTIEIVYKDSSSTTVFYGSSAEADIVYARIRAALSQAELLIHISTSMEDEQ